MRPKPCVKRGGVDDADAVVVAALGCRVLAVVEGWKVTWAEAWERMDPLEVVARRQARDQRKADSSKEGRQVLAREGLEALFGEGMTDDQSQKLEQYLEIWFEYERAYRPHLGAPRVSTYYRGAQSTEVHSDRDESEHRYEKMVAEAVSACMDELPWQQRSAITIHCEARKSGASVIRNPRMTIEEHHQQYQAGKLAIFGMPRMRELMR